MIKTYRKTATIQAEQFDGSFDMMNIYGITIITLTDNSRIYKLSTIEGAMELKLGDWLATGIDGEHWAINNDIFMKTYHELSVVPDDARRLIDEHKAKVDLSWLFYDVNEGIEDNEWISEHPNETAIAWLFGCQTEVTKR